MRQLNAFPGAARRTRRKWEHIMLRECKLAFVGAGTMGRAMIAGMLKQGLVTADQIVASDPSVEQGEQLKEKYGVAITTENLEAIRDADIIILAVKPQVLPKIFKELHDKAKEGVLILSIVAGAKINVLSGGFGREAVVRAMPNTPARVGKGMTVWTSTAQTTERQAEQAQRILTALGEEMYMEDEEYLDMATALSGTGPAYVFLFMEAMIDAGVHLGFSRWVAQKLVLQTMEGSVEMARQSGLHPVELRNSVTSPGGTTAEALYQFEKGGFRTVMSRAIWAAFQKSSYLGEMIEKKNGTSDNIHLDSIRGS
jgi:pyrroline-5-carboxylate reductase